MLLLFFFFVKKGKKKFSKKRCQTRPYIYAVMNSSESTKIRY